MVGNSWPWRRLAAAFATSVALIGAAWGQPPSTAELAELQRQMAAALGQGAAPQTVAGTLRSDDLWLDAEVVGGDVTVLWKRLSDGGARPGAAAAPLNLDIEGMAVGRRRAVPYRDLDLGAVFLFLVSGESEAARDRAIQRFAVLAAAVREDAANILVARAHPEFAVVEETGPAPSEAAVAEAFASALGASAPGAPAGDAVPAAFAYLSDRVKDTPTRGALVAPSALFPSDAAALEALPPIALKNGVSVYPAPPRAVDDGDAALGRLQVVAGATGGRLLPADVSGEGPAAIAEVFADLFSGGAVVFEPVPQERYRLPGELDRKVTLSLDPGGGAATTLALDRPTPQLQGAELYLSAATPGVWTGWLADPARRPYGLSILAVHVLVLLLVAAAAWRAFAPRVRLVLQAPGSALVAHVKRLPATIGRGAEADVRLDDPSVSRLHARISGDRRQGYVIEDLDSTNGLWARNTRVERKTLRSADTVTLGSARLRIFVR